MSLSTPGGRNLAVLGIGAIILAGITTGISLMVYRNSGDIYLDRSRPGYLPDEDEANEDPVTKTNFSYPDYGPLDKVELQRYLEELKAIKTRLDALSDPYAPSPLSDESLGIVEMPESPEDPNAAPATNGSASAANSPAPAANGPAKK